MAEINQPAPVKPIWPTRREQQHSKRELPDPSEEPDRKRQKKHDENDGKAAVIDEYV